MSDLDKSEIIVHRSDKSVLTIFLQIKEGLRVIYFDLTRL